MEMAVDGKTEYKLALATYKVSNSLNKNWQLFVKQIFSTLIVRMNIIAIDTGTS